MEAQKLNKILVRGLRPDQRAMELAEEYLKKHGYDFVHSNSLAARLDLADVLIGFVREVLESIDEQAL